MRLCKPLDWDTRHPSRKASQMILRWLSEAVKRRKDQKVRKCSRTGTNGCSSRPHTPISTAAPARANTARNWLSVSSWSKGVDGIVNWPGCEEQKCKCPDHGRLRSRQVYSWRAL